MKFILGVVIGIIIVPTVVVIYLVSGFAPTAATDKPLPFETWIAGTALQQRIQKEAPVRDLSSITTADLLSGADTYKKDCSVCHGLPDQPPSEIGNNMFPPAPQLMQPPRPRPGGAQGGRAPGMGDRGPGRPGGPRGAGPRPNGDFWRVKNGIRLTGMPSFEKNLTDDQMWQVIALLEHRRNMPPEVKAALEPSPEPAAAPALATPPAKGETPATRHPSATVQK